MSEDKNYSTGTVVMAFLVGGLVGAGIALLTAPQSGKETREKIKELACEAKEKIKCVADDAKEKIHDSYRHAKEVVGDRKSMVAAAIEAGKKAMEEEKHRLAEKG
jgi:gas vesicle protein